MKQRRLLEISKYIADYGCYFMSLLYYIREPDYNDIFNYYDIFTKKGYMDKDCYITNPAAILKYLTNKNWTIKQSKTYDDKADYAIAKYYNPRTGHSHFVVANSNRVIYDPLGYSVTVNEGYIDSWRLFYSNI